MPLNFNDNLPTKFPSPKFLTLNNFKKGVITLIDKSRLPKNALEQADNIFLVEDGQPTVRPGTDWFGVALPNGEEIDGFGYFDFEGAIHIVAVGGGVVYRSDDDAATWDECTGFTLTSGLVTEMNQYDNHLYLTNGTDNITRYDGTLNLTQYGELATPGAPSAVETALSGSGINYNYKVARVNEVGFSTASIKNTGTVSTNLDRSTWEAGTNYVTLTTPVSVSGQTRWDIYLSTDDTNYYYLSSVSSGDEGTTADFVDDGTAFVVPSTTAPTDSTATGPKVEELVNVGSRMYGIRDTENRYRIWFSSGSTPKGAFSSAYDGGYLDWQEGGKYIPKQVADYRDGKGTPLATIWCDSADGEGCIIQMSLDVFTIGNVSVTVPAAYKLPGSRGTPAPGSVVNVLNDYFFYNSQAIYNLGSRQNFQNLLSTDEASSNIRPTIKQVSSTAESGIATAYYDAKVYFSVPYGSDSNNNTAVYDTERKAWLPYAFTKGFKKFLRYTTTDGGRKLLAITPGDNRITKIATSIQGDYGEAFKTELKTGLYPTSKNRFEFQWTEEAEMEFSNPTGTVEIELTGIERGKGFTSQGSASVTAILSSTGHGTALHGTLSHGDTSTAIDTYSESSVKRYFRVGRELNAIQWKVTTESLDGYYVLRTLQTWGTDTTGGKPRSWRITTD